MFFGSERMALEAARFVDSIEINGAYTHAVHRRDCPGLSMEGGFVWVSDSQAVPLSNVKQFVLAAKEAAPPPANDNAQPAPIEAPKALAKGPKVKR